MSAAVQSGADAVYLSFGNVSGSTQFKLTEDEFGRAAEFCRVRGVKLYYSADLSPFDEEFTAALENARRAARMGADAIIVNDLGLLWALRQAIPSMPLHAGPKLGIHSIEGLRLIQAMGVRRVSLSYTLSSQNIQAICKESSIEIEVAVHGPMCPAFPGQCSLGTLTEGTVPLREMCLMHCLSKFPAGARGRHPFALKDLCLIDQLEQLSSWGVSAVRIDGRNRRPEYSAAVTGVYSRVLKTGTPPNDDDMALLSRAYPSSGFTHGFFDSKDPADMCGLAGSEPQEDTPFYNAMRRDYLNHEFQRVPVDFSARVALNEPLMLAAWDDRGNRVSGEGAVPELAFHREIDLSYMRTELSHTGGTPFYLRTVKCETQKGLYIRPQDIGELRDKLLSELMERRIYHEPRAEETFEQLPSVPNSTEPPALTVWVSRHDQLSGGLLELAPQVVYVPLQLAAEHPDAISPYISAPGITVCAALPRVVTDSDLGSITGLLLKVRQLGIEEVLAGSMEQILFLLRLGFRVRGDYSLNIRNSASLYALSSFHLKSVTLSPELSAARVRSISKSVDSELIIYGRLPLMYMASCPVKNFTGVCTCDSFTGIVDTDGFTYPVMREWNCRTMVLSPQKLFLANRSREYLAAGLWGVRLMFTTENSSECVAIAKRYLEIGNYEPGGVTSGMF